MDTSLENGPDCEEDDLEITDSVPSCNGLPSNTSLVVLFEPSLTVNGEKDEDDYSSGKGTSISRICECAIASGSLSI